MLSNYPPGVSGREDEIVGAPGFEGVRTCAVCEATGPVDGVVLRGGIEVWDCPECEAENEHDRAPDLGDEWHDAMIARGEARAEAEYDRDHGW